MLDLEADHGFSLERFETVSSTQDVLRDRLEADELCPGVAVRARAQTDGRGRRGGSWHSAAGGSYQSVMLPRSTLTGNSAGASAGALLPLALGVGVARALTKAGARTQVKWPNDLVLGGRKLGGIIVEVIAGVPLAGIGVNVDNDVPESAAALRGWDVDVVGDLVLHGVRHALTDLVPDAPAVVEGFATVDWLHDKAVLMAGGSTTGRGRGIDMNGCLLLLGPDGTVDRYCAGHVVAIDGVTWAAAR